VCDNLRDREGCCFNVEAALDDSEIGRYGSEVLVGVLVGQVTEA
jgi:hypothetical protein